VLETRISPGAAADAIRAPMDTAMPAVAVGDLALAGVEPGPDLELEWTERVADRRRCENRPRRPVEGGEEAVAGRVELAALEAGELAADDSVMPLQQLPPLRVTESCRPLGRADDVGEEDGREDALRLHLARELRDELRRRGHHRPVGLVVDPREDAC